MYICIYIYIHMFSSRKTREPRATGDRLGETSRIECIAALVKTKDRAAPRAHTRVRCGKFVDLSESERCNLFTSTCIARSGRIEHPRHIRLCRCSEASIVQCSMIQYSIVWYSIVQCQCQCSIVKSSLVQSSLVQSSIVQYSIASRIARTEPSRQAPRICPEKRDPDVDCEHLQNPQRRLECVSHSSSIGLRSH